MNTEMSYDRACEILGLTTPKSVKENARLASIMTGMFSAKTPLRFKVAASVLIKAAE